MIGAWGTTLQHQTVSRLNLDCGPRKSRCLLVDSSQLIHNSNWALAVISGRGPVVDAPQCLHRHLVCSTLVFPSLTSLFAHNPYRRRIITMITLHAFTSCRFPHSPSRIRLIQNPVGVF